MCSPYPEFVINVILKRTEIMFVFCINFFTNEYFVLTRLTVYTNTLSLIRIPGGSRNLFALSGIRNKRHLH